MSSPSRAETPSGGVWAWPAVTRNVPVARNAVTAHLRHADTPDPPLEDVRLALSEAVSNVVMHAYPAGAAPGDMRVRIEFLSRRAFVVTVEDDGCGLAPRLDSPGLGMGLPLMKALSQHLETTRMPAGGTRLSLWFSSTDDAVLN